MARIFDMVTKRLLLTGLDAALTKYARTEDRTLAFDPEMEKALPTLARIIGEPGGDLDASSVLGRMHWLRYCLLPEGEDRPEYEAAVYWLWPVRRQRPGHLSAHLQQVLAEPGYGHCATGRLARFGLTDDVADLDRAVWLLRGALRDRAPHEPYHRDLLAEALRLRGERTGDVGDLDAAVTLATATLAGTPAADEDRHVRASRLGLALLTRAALTGREDDQEQAVVRLREAAAASPGDENRAVHANNLSRALRGRAEATGSLEDLEEAVAEATRAVRGCAPEGPRYATALGNLSDALRVRGESTGDRTDLDNAVEAARDAVAQPGQAPSAQARHQSALSGALTVKAEIERDADLAGLAVRAGRKAADLCPRDHPDQGLIQVNLGNTLRVRAELVGTPEAVGEAVETARSAAGHPLPGHARPLALSNLANALLSRALSVPGPVSGDVDAAIEALVRAAGLLSPGHPFAPTVQHNLGNAYRVRFELACRIEDMEAGVAAYRLAAASPSPSQAVLAAMGWGWLAALAERWELSAEGYRAAGELVGPVAARTVALADREYRLTKVEGASWSATAALLNAGDVDTAVTLFERMRGVLFGQALDERPDLTDLRRLDAGLADRFTACRDTLRQLDAATADGPSALSAGGARFSSARHRRVGEELADVVRKIRALPGHADFLKPPPLADLLASLPDGHTVLVNCSVLRSDAIVVSRDGVRPPVALPGLTVTAAAEHGAALLEAVDEAERAAGPALAPAAQARIDETLRWLWDTVAGPVLDSLGEPPDGGPARIWWCPSGAVSFLPLHAAGRHDTRFDTRPLTVMDRAVSSYTPTLRALAHATRPAAPGTSGTPVRVAAVGVPHVAGAPLPDGRPLPDLEGAEDEVALIRTLFGKRADTVCGPEVTFAGVVDLLRHASWVHFACHGISDPAGASAGRLLLPDHRTRPLTVPEIAALPLDHAEFAFLSACRTAAATLRLTDEALHLASAFQVSGYRQVVGTLWPVDDALTLAPVRTVYERLAADGDADGAATALHEAVLRLRALWSRAPSVWAGYVHSGAPAGRR
ncbi:CHAT domain-containing protein [Streptomyces sp. NPDC046860]|uniref:CHAT domain-containing tetratricopeptide repeat protein n=1 Tax=Streptomyces sp. NPDC046860 TaxID=3154495 RepID=UPI0033E2B906